MRDTSYDVAPLLNDSPEVSFWFDKYYVVVSFNELVLGYDANIYTQTQDGELIHYTTTGGKSPKSASMSARQIILGKIKRT
tara:strand:+ start:310 stop:552 length:243 start_codon:yes stop_codon:yes gene_type:complete